VKNSPTWLRCITCGYGVEPSLAYCPECGARNSSGSRDWRAKVFGESAAPPVTCHRTLEAKTRALLEQVRDDLARFRSQQALLEDRLRQARTANRPSPALDKALALVTEAVASRRRAEAQCHLALANLSLDRLDNELTLWSLPDPPAAHGEADLDWRRVVHRNSLDTGGTPATACAVHPDGSILAASTRDGMLCAWDLASGSEAPIHTEGDLPWTAMTFSPEGKWLIAGAAGGEIRAWDTAEWSARQDMGRHDGGVRALVVAPDGSWVATGGKDGVIRFWDCARSGERFSLEGHKEAIASLAVTPNGAWLASGSWGGVLKLWSIRRRAEQGSVTAHEGAILALAFHPDGVRLASGGWDKTVRLWSFHKDRAARLIGSHDLGVHSLAFSRDGHWLASAGGDGAIHVRSTQDFETTATLRRGPEPVLGVAFSPARPELYACGGAGIGVWSSLVPPLSLFRRIADAARLAAPRQGVTGPDAPAVTLRAHQLVTRAVHVTITRLVALAQDRGVAAGDDPPRTQDLEDCLARWVDDLRKVDADTALQEPLAHEVARMQSARADLAGHAMLAATTQLVRRIEEQIAGLEAADDASCQQRLAQLQVCEQRAIRWHASLCPTAASTTTIQHAAGSLQEIIDQLPGVVDLVLARQAMAMVARVSPIADQEPAVALRRLHASLRRETQGPRAWDDATRSGTEPVVLGDASAGGILEDLERRYRDISSELEALREVDEILR
jgi:WD40 repeat protein